MSAVGTRKLVTRRLPTLSATASYTTPTPSSSPATILCGNEKVCRRTTRATDYIGRNGRFRRPTSAMIRTQRCKIRAALLSIFSDADVKRRRPALSISCVVCRFNTLNLHNIMLSVNGDDGNSFHRNLIRPATLRLLNPQSGGR
jgi:hypothetical protein